MNELNSAKSYLRGCKLTRLGLPLNILENGFYNVDLNSIQDGITLLNISEICGIGKEYRWGIKPVIIKYSGRCIATWLTGFRYFLGHHYLYTSGGEISCIDTYDIEVYEIDDFAYEFEVKGC